MKMINLEINRRKELLDEAEISYHECIKQLRDELIKEIAIDDVKTKRDSIKLRIAEDNDDYYEIEAVLSLVIGEEEVGYYSLVWDNNFTFLDDTLSLY